MGGERVIVSPSPLLAAVIQRQFAQSHIETGRMSWPAASVFSIAAWMRQTWRELRSRLGMDVPGLLSPAQELVLWQHAIRETGHSLFDVASTAQGGSPSRTCDRRVGCPCPASSLGQRSGRRNLSSLVDFRPASMPRAELDVRRGSVEDDFGQHTEAGMAEHDCFCRVHGTCAGTANASFATERRKRQRAVYGVRSFSGLRANSELRDARGGIRFCRTVGASAYERDNSDPLPCRHAGPSVPAFGY